MKNLVARGAVAALCALAPFANVWAQPSSSAPAGAPVAPASDIDALRERVAAFWAARVNGDGNAQWQLLEPRGKARTTPAEYGAVGAGKYLAYQVEDATVTGFFATVKVRLVFVPVLPAAPVQWRAPALPPTMPPTVSMIEDRWIRIKGVWYRVLEQE